MSKRGIILSGGFISENDPLNKYINKESVIVCADSGYIFAQKHGIAVDVLVGDFDSLSEAGYDIPDRDIKVLTFNPEKDQSDTQLCVDFLASSGIKEIYIFGALGGKRFDHAFANIQLLEYGLLKGLQIYIINENSEIFMISDNSVTIKGKKGDYISVFALHEAEKINYSGLKYSLTDGYMKSSVPLGLSNSMEEDEVTISVEKGVLLIIHTGGDFVEKRHRKIK